MAETFKRITSRGIGTTRTRVGGYTVPVGATAIVIGTSIANFLDTNVKATFEHHDGGSYTVIAKNIGLTPGQSFAPSGEMNKIVMQAGDGLFVNSDTAAALDVVISILEIS
jgi:hypothetical protein